MIIGSGSVEYEWIGDWASVPDEERARNGWAHPGVVVTQSGEVMTFHPRSPEILVFDLDGNFVRSWETDLVDGHGMCLAAEDSIEYLWTADPGAKRDADAGYQNRPVVRRGRAVKTTLNGLSLLTIEAPDHPVYDAGTFSATSVTVNQKHHGGNGDIWVADGYGESYVHRFDSSGEYLDSINGEEGTAGRFSCPHAVFVDTRKSEPELYIADRANRRIQVYDLERKFKRAFGSDFLTSPSALTTSGDLLIVAELRARLTVLDLEDRLVGYLGADERISDVERGSPQDVPGWPNNLDEKGDPVRSRILEPGKFNSPHGVAADADGNLYVVEWLIGGRYTKLRKI